MIIGAVLSFNEGFFTFKGSKILSKLRTPCFQIIIQDKGITCTSKKIEYIFSEDLTETVAKVMGKTYRPTQIKGLYNDLHSELWISTQIDAGDINEKLRGYAQASKGKILFTQEFDNLSQSYPEIQKIINLAEIQNKNVIKQYCSLQIEQINQQIRHLTGDKNMFSDIISSL